MDFTEVPVTSERKSKKKKNKKAGNKRMSEAENGESAGVEKKSEEKMENGESSAAFPPTFSVSEIKNKQRRHMMFMKLKQEKRKVKRTYRSDRESPAPPKEVPKTIENQRVFDETTVDLEDEEIAFDEGTDEFSAYFNRLTNPQVLITTSDRPRGKTVRFCEQLASVIPNAHVYYRRGLALKKIIPQCVARNFTYLMVINEDRLVPSILKNVNMRGQKAN
uniref:Ribosome production factor 1 n=1 Tax=Oryzias sinensis TaxID=183150 RepID=A0A8C8DMZ7_9TELE